MFLNIFTLLLPLSSAFDKLNGIDYGRLPTLYKLDDYRKCLKSEGVYCVLNIALSAPPDNSLIRLIEEYSKPRIHYKRNRIERGVCVTDRCNYDKNNMKENLHLQILENCLNESFSNEYQLEAKVTIRYCNKSKISYHYDLGDWIFGIVLASIVLLNIYATIYDVCLPNGNKEIGNPYLLSFSLTRSWGHLVSPQTPRFATIDALRTILSFSVVFSHTVIIFGSAFVDNPEDIEKAYENPLSYIVFNIPIVLQTYFIISGCLFSYTSAVHPEWLKSILIPIVCRWCRLTPGLAFLLGFSTTWYRHLGSGPLWNYYVSPMVNDCRQYWWTHILFFNNYVKETCNIHTWYLAADIQIYAVALILFIITRKRGRIVSIILMLILGCVAPALHDWLQDVDGVFITYPEMFRTLEDDSFSLVHISFYNNLCGFSMGLLLGIVILNGEKYQGHFLNHKRKLSMLFWLLLPVPLLILISGYFVYPNGERPSLSIRIAYSALLRPLFGAVMSVQILIVMFKVEDKFRPILEWPGWRIPSRLTYGVFLVHISIIHYIQGTKTQLHNASLFNLLITNLGVVWLSYMIAVPIFLLVETPMSKITKVCLLSLNSLKVNKNK